MGSRRDGKAPPHPPRRAGACAQGFEAIITPDSKLFVSGAVSTPICVLPLREVRDIVTCTPNTSNYLLNSDSARGLLWG